MAIVKYIARKNSCAADIANNQPVSVIIGHIVIVLELKVYIICSKRIETENPGDMGLKFFPLSILCVVAGLLEQ